MRKLSILCLVVAALNAAVYYEPKIKEQKDGYKYGQTINLSDASMAGWIKSKEIDARADY